MKKKNFWILVLIVSFVLIASTVFAASCSEPGTDNSQSEEQGFYYNGILLGVTQQADYDTDWLSDRFEQEHGTNPLKVDTDGDGIDDFNEIFTYPHLLNPLDPTDAQEFLAMIPNVEAKFWKWHETGDTGSDAPFTKVVDVAKRDPLVQWYADHVFIEWKDVARTEGWLNVNEERLFQEYGIGYEAGGHAVHPAYYLTHGRKGICLEVSLAHYSILELMDYECVSVSGSGENGVGHDWLEIETGGKVYAVDFNRVEWAESFYQRSNYIIEFRNDW